MASSGKKKRKPVRATKRKAKPAAEPSVKKRRRLSSSPEATRARVYRAEQKKRAAKKQRAAKKAARTRKRNRLERESAELGELERIADERAADERRSSGDEGQLLSDALDEMRNTAASVYPTSLTLTEPEVGARTPWTVVGKFEFSADVGYSELFDVLAAWRDDLILEARIHPQRLSQIRIWYHDPNAKRGESDSIVSSIGPWETIISEIAHETDPSDDESLSARFVRRRIALGAIREYHHEGGICLFQRRARELARNLALGVRAGGRATQRSDGSR